MEASEVRKPVLSFGISSILGTHDGKGRRQSLGKQKRKHNQTDLPSAAAVVTSQHNRYSNSSPHSPAIGETCRGLIRSEKADGEDDNSRPQTTDSLRTLSKSASLPLLPQHLPTQAYLYKSLDRYRPKNFAEYRRVGHPYSNRTPPKRKKPRTTFSREQIAELEMRFTDQKYLASTERLRLAKDLQLTDAQVKTWFQNRRTKWRRQTAEEREAERNATTKYIIKMQQSAAAVAAGAAFWSPILPLPGSALTSVAGSSV